MSSAVRFQNQRELMKVKSWDFLFRVISCFGIMVLGFYIWTLESIFLNIAGLVLLGAGMAHGVELQHQCVHGNGFKIRNLNILFGWLLGAPMLVSFNSYRSQHLWHHRYLGTPMDKEFFQSSQHAKLNTWQKIIEYVFRYKRLKDLLRKMANHQDRNFLLIFSIVLLTAVMMTGSAYIAIGWLAALILVAEPLHNFIELPEHYGCDRSTRKVGQNTRTLRSNWFMTWLTNGNNFHVEHHSHPGVPMQNMRKLHESMRPSISNYHNGYWNFLLTLQQNENTDQGTL